MTHDDALTALADHPHAWRFRQLCDDPDIEVRDAWRLEIVRIARDEPPPARPAIRVDYGDVPAGSPGPCGGCPGQVA